MVFLWAELCNVQDYGFARGFCLCVDCDAGFQFRDCGGWEDDRGITVGLLAPRWTPDCSDVRRRPGGVAHDHVDLASNPAVQPGERKPVFPLDEAPQALARAGVDSLESGLVVQRFEHVR